MHFYFIVRRIGKVTATVLDFYKRAEQKTIRVELCVGTESATRALNDRHFYTVQKRLPENEKITI